MRFSKRILITVAAAMAVAFPAGAAMAQSYTGSWPVTVTGSHHSNGTSCLKLTDNGSQGWPHSGSASLGGSLSYGTFQVINHTLVATIQAQGYGQNAGLVFVGKAERDGIGSGVFEDVYGGEDFDSGSLTFGMK